MPEYRRFVAYFYEYINGKKQKNAGFAKVELRNGMWRVLFRLTIPMSLKVPARVYGFVREGGYLLGIPLGNMSANSQRAEEWAWRADAPIGFDKYYFSQISGIWIENPDGRTFITVWDDEALEPDRFVLEIPEPETDTMEVMPERSGEVLAALTVDIPDPGAANAPGPIALELPFGHPTEASEPVAPELLSGDPEGEPVPTAPELLPGDPEGEPVSVPQEVPAKQPEGMPGSIPSEVPLEMPGEMTRPIPTEEPGSQPMEAPPWAVPEMPGMSAFVLSDSPQAGEEGSACKKREKVSAGEPLNLTERENCVESLLQSRQRFCPFADEEFSDCVQIRMCDLVALQQEGWQVGRSNFLWHGYSQYRHLLLGRYQGRGYVLGVPGIFSRQEEYVAGVFDYGKFKLSSLGGCGRRLGYWYQILQETT